MNEKLKAYLLDNKMCEYNESNMQAIIFAYSEEEARGLRHYAVDIEDDIYSLKRYESADTYEQEGKPHIAGGTKYDEMFYELEWYSCYSDRCSCCGRYPYDSIPDSFMAHEDGDECIRCVNEWADQPDK